MRPCYSSLPPPPHTHTHRIALIGLLRDVVRDERETLRGMWHRRLCRYLGAWARAHVYTRLLSLSHTHTHTGTGLCTSPDADDAMTKRTRGLPRRGIFGGGASLRAASCVSGMRQEEGGGGGGQRQPKRKPAQIKVHQERKKSCPQGVHAPYTGWRSAGAASDVVKRAKEGCVCVRVYI